MLNQEEKVYKEEKEERKDLEEKVLESASINVVQTYGSAVKEHIVAYSGVDNENERTLKRSLSSVADSAINPDYRMANLKQQAGFSAEIKSVARKNAANIISGKEERYIRTDDIDGHTNDPIFDISIIDKDGKIIESQSSQMKFVGNSSKEFLRLLMTSKKYNKYFEADAIIDVPDDYYDDLVGTNGSTGLIDEQISELLVKKKRTEEIGNVDATIKIEKKIEKYKELKCKLRKSDLTKEEAFWARVDPKLSTASDVIGIANKAGLKQAKKGAAIGASLSIVRNVVACSKNEKTSLEAAKDIAIDASESALKSYSIAFSGSIIKGSLQNAPSEYLRGLSNTNIASTIVTSSANVCRVMIKYLRGEIDSVECIELLGKQGIGQLGSVMYATIFATAVAGATPEIITAAVGMAGGVIGYSASVAIYDELCKSLKEEKIAKEERIIVEMQCNEAVAMICEYRHEIESFVNAYFAEHIDIISDALQQIDNSFLENDINGFIRGNNMLQEFFGKGIQFYSFEDFDEFMLSDDKLSF